jgi:hypothetical protein
MSVFLSFLSRHNRFLLGLELYGGVFFGGGVFWSRMRLRRFGLFHSLGGQMGILLFAVALLSLCRFSVRRGIFVHYLFSSFRQEELLAPTFVTVFLFFFLPSAPP